MLCAGTSAPLHRRLLRLLEYFALDGTSSHSRAARLRAVALVDAPLRLAVGAHFQMFGAVLQALGSPQQLKAWMPQLGAVKILGCLALTGACLMTASLRSSAHASKYL